MKLLRAAAFYLLVVLTVSRTSALDFQLSAEWAKAIPVFQANVDKVGEHRYTNYREPVVVKTNSGKLIVGVHAGNRLSWRNVRGRISRYAFLLTMENPGARSLSPLSTATTPVSVMALFTIRKRIGFYFSTPSTTGIIGKLEKAEAKR